MPTYTFRDNNTGEEFDEAMMISELDSYMNNNPHVSQVIGAPKLLHERGTNLKVDDGFREVTSKIKDTYKINAIKDY